MKTKLNSFLIVLALLTSVHSVIAQGTAFTYQGKLSNTNGLASGTYDLTFKLFNASSGGSQIGSSITASSTVISNGLFTTTLDFGGVFNGSSYWLEISVRTNGVVSFTTLTPRQQLTPTPYAITAENVDGLVSASQLTGTVPTTTLTGANGSGLTSLNASQLTSGTVPDIRLSPNVALLNANQTFTGNNAFAGPGESIIVNTGPISTTPFTGLGFQYYPNTGEGAILSSYDDGYGFLSFYTKQGLGYPLVEQVQIDKFGGVAMDLQNYNNGVLNDGTTNGVGLTFGTTSGEGIASQRTAGIDQYSLSFYTAFVNRMTIVNNGFIGIGTTNPTAKLHVSGAAGVDGIRYPDGSLQTTAPQSSFNSGLGLSPATTNTFIGPTTSVIITSTSQRVLVTANKALGSTSAAGANNLDLFIGYRKSGSTLAPTSVGGGTFGQSVSVNTRVLFGLSGIISGLTPGTYDVGLMGSSTDAVDWNNNEWGYVTALIF